MGDYSHGGILLSYLLNQEKIMNEVYYIVGHPINGIWLNPNEWLADDEGRLRLFKGKAVAKAYLKRLIEATGDTVSDVELEDNYVFEIAEPDEIINGVITAV